MKNIVLMTAALFALAGCAATYEPPVSLAQNASVRLSYPAPVVFRAAERALVSAGYQITDANRSAGIISTAPRDMHLTPDEADCGTTLGLNYLKDNRTSTRVSMGVIINMGRITVQSNIQGNYRPGDVMQNITLTCVSKGLLEANMLNRIKAELGQPQP